MYARNANHFCRLSSVQKLMYLLCPQRFSSENVVALCFLSWWVFFCTTWISESFKVSDQFRWNSDGQTASSYRLLRIALHCTVMTSQKKLLFMKSEIFICLEGSQCDWQVTDEGILWALFSINYQLLMNSLSSSC